MIRMLPPISISRSKACSSFAMSSKCSPVVGSSKMYSVPSARGLAQMGRQLHALRFPTAESVVADWPSRRYPSPTSFNTFKLVHQARHREKNDSASFTVSCSTS